MKYNINSVHNSFIDYFFKWFYFCIKGQTGIKQKIGFLNKVWSAIYIFLFFSLLILFLFIILVIISNNINIPYLSYIVSLIDFNLVNTSVDFSHKKLINYIYGESAIKLFILIVIITTKYFKRIFKNIFVIQEIDFKKEIYKHKYVNLILLFSYFYVYGIVFSMAIFAILVILLVNCNFFVKETIEN